MRIIHAFNQPLNRSLNFLSRLLQQFISDFLLRSMPFLILRLLTI